jgi:16S rRNA (guanine1207-N2)-methyltransferase
MPAVQDAPLQTLMLPFATGALRWPDGTALFLRARAGWPLREQARGPVLCEQDWYPAAEALRREGLAPIAGDASPRPDGAGHPLVLVLPPRQREEARALLARAVALATPGGVVVACQANAEGARSGEADLARLAPLAGTLTKSHCRVYWTAPLAAHADPALVEAWRALDAPRPILDGRFLSRPGVFAWDRVDPASRLLAEQLPDTLAGRGADLGCGWGFLAAQLLERCAAITALDLYEAERRALALAERNLAPWAGTRALGLHWADVTAGLPARDYDFIVSNPPFHGAARDGRPQIGQAFIAAAAAALRPGGRLWLVANRHLPYEQALAAGFAEVKVLAERDGYKALVATRAGGRR